MSTIIFLLVLATIFATAVLEKSVNESNLFRETAQKMGYTDLEVPDVKINSTWDDHLFQCDSYDGDGRRLIALKYGQIRRITFCMGPKGEPVIYDAKEVPTLPFWADKKSAKIIYTKAENIEAFRLLEDYGHLIFL